jgi:hypothetical protein
MLQQKFPSIDNMPAFKPASIKQIGPSVLVSGADSIAQPSELVTGQVCVCMHVSAFGVCSGSLLTSTDLSYISRQEFKIYVSNFPKSADVEVSIGRYSPTQHANTNPRVSSPPLTCVIPLDRCC